MVSVIATVTPSADRGTAAAASRHRLPGRRPSGKTSSRIRNPTTCHDQIVPLHQASRPQASSAGTPSIDTAIPASAPDAGVAGARIATSQPSAKGTSPSR
ncbi:hypothetical protein [Nonomuraea rubra]|uniref:Uncharacterized protein n=1 Tax=Nonomuraea rubra TaxID=46180 RepID=A0A7X0NXQ6_9ACTN|nr:hypothetical protein [Nonomuraea rubra]MBB6551562.1 hypothetical protein [Nonomuraea rubra]